MLNKRNRLTKQKDFDHVFQKGLSGFDKNLGAKIVKNNFQENRFGVIVSSKVSKKAVERNKTKRRIREIIKNHLDKIAPGFDIVIVVLPESQKKSFKELENSFLKNLKKLKLL